MKRKAWHGIVIVFGMLFLVCNATAADIDYGALSAKLLDDKLAPAEREKLVATEGAAAGPLIVAMTEKLKSGTPEEYKRIPWIWRVSVAAGKRNHTAELRSLLYASLPHMDQPLLDWQAVVIGGGIINGISLQGVWPSERIEELLGNEKKLKARWERSLELAAAMVENEKVPTGTRYDALRMIALRPWDKSGKQLTKYLAAGVHAELQQGAVSGLVDVKSRHATSALIGAISHLTGGNLNFALDGLLRDESRMSALLDAIAAGKIDKAKLGEDRMNKLRNVSNKSLRARVARVLDPKLPPQKLSANYSVGVAEIDVTPDYPVRLHGYLARTSESQGVVQKIFAKALAIDNGKESPSILISVDNCMVPEHMRDDLLKRLANKGVTSDKLAICASHTHSAPKLARAADNIFGMDLPRDQQERIERYTKDLTDKMEQVVLAALKQRKPASLSHAKTSATFAANRRTKGGPVDHDLPVLRVADADGKLRALVVNYACHCTTLSNEPNEICGDWAGYAQEFLQRDHPGAIVLTIIGAGADANPAPRPGVEYAKQHGQSIATAVNELLKTPFKEIRSPLQGQTKRVQLPFDKHPTQEEWEQRAQKNDPTGYHAKKQLERLKRGEALQTELPYLVQAWNFGDELAMVFLPGEVVVDYSLRIKKEYDRNRIWVTAYANDVPCYIPSKRILAEGGYEGGGAMIYYDRPTRLGPDTEELIIGAVNQLVPQAFSTGESLSEFPPPKLPTEVARTFKTKPGFVVDLIACEPTIVDPVAVDFGTDGRLWVLEMHDYPSGMDGNLKPGGRVKVAADKDGDGFFETATLFLDDLPFPTGLMQWRNGVIVCAAPDILYAEDTDGDGKADMVKKLFTGFATHNYQARVNSLRWGLDNWVYGASGLFGGKIKSEITGQEVECSRRDIRFNPDTGEIEPVNGVSQQGRARDDWGNWFGGDNSTLLWNFPMADYYVRRNPHVTTPDPRVYGAKDPQPNALYPVSRTLERFNNPNSANRTTSASGMEIYRDELLGQDFTGNAFVGETVHNLVHRLKLTSDGVTVTGRRSEDEQKSEFLASTDNWFRPVEVRTGRDGALWVIDMYRFVIEHPIWIPAERLAKLDVRAGHDRGRIFRIYPAGTKLRANINLTELSSAMLVELFNTPNGTERDLIHRELFQRQDRTVTRSLQKLALESGLPAVRAQALCVLQGIKTVSTEDMARGMEDSDPRVRRNAIRVSEELLAGGKGRERYRMAELWWSPGISFFRDRLLSMTADSDRGVRYQLALSLGEWRDPRAAPPLAEIACKDIGDSWIRAAVLSSAIYYPDVILKAVMELPPETAGRTEMVGQLIATAVGVNDRKVLEATFIAIAPPAEQKIEAWRLVVLANLQEALERKKIPLAKFVASNSEGRTAVDRIRNAIEGAGELCREKSRTVDEREAALRLLASASSEADLLTLIAFASDDSNARLQKAAMTSLRRQRDPKLPELLVSAWKNFLVSQRAAIIEILLAREEGIAALLSAVEHGTVVVSEVSAANRQQLLQHQNEQVATKAAALFPQNKARQDVLAKFLAEVPKLAGNVERGAKVYSESCASCHAFRGIGTAIGPDLLPLVDKSIEDFLVAILDPNAVIEPRFVQYTIDTKDDRSLSGVVSSETATSLVLAQAGGAKEKILRSDIVQMTASSLSLMPEGLEQSRTAQDFADMLAYIKDKPAVFGKATPEQAVAARKKFLATGDMTLTRLISASEKLDYPSWLGVLPLAHCRQTDGNSKVAWEGTTISGSPTAEQFYIFNIPAAMGLHSAPAGKFHLKVNGKSGLDFNVALEGQSWQSSDGKVMMRYQVMENNAEDSNGILSISVRGDLIVSNKATEFEVTASAANSQRWFGVYLVSPEKVESAKSQ